MSPDEKSDDAVKVIKDERARAAEDAKADKSSGGKAGAQGTRKPVRRRKSKTKLAEEIFPIDHWRKVSDFLLDGATFAANTKERSPEEKEAVGLTGRALVVKHLGATAYAEEIMFFMVILPIAVSITIEAVQNYRAGRTENGTADRDNGGSDADKKPTRTDFGEIRVGQNVSDAKGPAIR